jgi:hypothetical protein
MRRSFIDKYLFDILAELMVKVPFNLYFSFFINLATTDIWQLIKGINKRNNIKWNQMIIRTKKKMK